MLSKIPSSSQWMPCIEVLELSEIGAFQDHLLRLPPDVRRQRFGNCVTSDFLLSYAHTAFRAGTVVLACRIDGVVRGLAELRAVDAAGRAAEAAFTVEPDWQGRGIGSALMAAIVAEARMMNFAEIYVCCQRQNRRMQHITEATGGILEFIGGECTGTIRITELPLVSFLDPGSTTTAVAMRLL